MGARHDVGLSGCDECEGGRPQQDEHDRAGLQDRPQTKPLGDGGGFLLQAQQVGVAQLGDSGPETVDEGGALVLEAGDGDHIGEFGQFDVLG